MSRDLDRICQKKPAFPELKRTTETGLITIKLMKYRLNILKEHGLGLKEIKETIARIDPLPGAREFLDKLRHRLKLSSSVTPFPVRRSSYEKLGYPTIFCNTLVVGENGEITDFKMRCEKSNTPL